MFEMFVTVAAALAATIYGVSQSVFMNGPHRNYYRIGAILLIVIGYLSYRIYHSIKNSLITKMNVNLEDYLYYEKYTSLLYRIGYFLSYLIQNILFDYVYMKRNFNFCKGLDVYDGGVSEYYIKFRNTWYKYMKLTILRHKVSLRKLQAFSCAMKNEMIENAVSTPEEKERYRAYTRMIQNYFEEHHEMTRDLMERLPGYTTIPYYYKINLLKRFEVILYVEKHEPKIIDLIHRQNLRASRDVNDFKKMDLK